MELRGGYDTVELAYCATYSTELVERLEKERDLCLAEHAEVREFANDWVIVPTGKRASTGGPFYAYHLRRESVEVFFCKNADGSKTGFYNILVRFGAMPLLMRGHDWCFALIRQLFEDLHVEVISERLSRIDLAIDLVDYSVQHWHDLVESGARCCRSYHGSKMRYETASPVQPDSVTTYEVRGVGTGFTFGKGTMIRVYDKLREVVYQSRDKIMPMVEYRWGGKMPEAATRVEVQIRREWLKKNPFKKAINTFADFVEDQVKILRYFLSEWFRVLNKVPDRKNNNQSKVFTDPQWEKMVSAACDLYSKKLVCEKIASKDFEARDYLLDQMVGVAQAIIAKAPERYTHFAGDFCNPDSKFEDHHDDYVLALVMQTLMSVTDEEREKRTKRFQKKIEKRKSLYPFAESEACCA